MRFTAHLFTPGPALSQKLKIFHQSYGFAVCTTWNRTSRQFWRVKSWGFSGKGRADKKHQLMDRPRYKGLFSCCKSQCLFLVIYNLLYNYLTGRYFGDKCSILLQKHPELREERGIFPPRILQSCYHKFKKWTLTSSPFSALQAI